MRHLSPPSVAVLDYGSGNVHSASKALTAAGADVTLSRDPGLIERADGLVVPGVGAFAAVMKQLGEVDGAELITRRLAAGRAVFGICVGAQILFAHGREHGISSNGLGCWHGTVQQLTAERLPHIGWNTVEAPATSALFRGITHERFYFVHSYAVTQWLPVAPAQTAHPPNRSDDAEGTLVTWSEYGERFIAAVEDGPLTATQFHPEKSGAAGIQLLRNWITSL